MLMESHQERDLANRASGRERRKIAAPRMTTLTSPAHHQLLM